MTKPRGPYTCLYREIWNNEKFWGMSETAQLIYIHILSTPMGNGLGCYKAGIEALAEDKRMASEAFRKAFQEVLAKGFVEYDEIHRVLWIPKYIEKNPPGNPNVLKSWARIYSTLPDCELKAKCYLEVKAFSEGSARAKPEAWTEAFTGAFGAPPKGFAKGFAEGLPKALPKESGNMALSLSSSYSGEGGENAPACDQDLKDENESERSSVPPKPDPTVQGAQGTHIDGEASVILMALREEFGDRLGDVREATIAKLCNDLAGEAYAMIDPSDEIRNAAEWERNAPPSKKKKNAGIPAFIRKWCARSQKDLAGNPHSQPAAVPRKEPKYMGPERDYFDDE